MESRAYMILDEIQDWQSLDPFIKAPPMPGAAAIEEARRLQLVTPVVKVSWSVGKAFVNITPETCPDREKHGKLRPDWNCRTCGWLDEHVPESAKVAWRKAYGHG